MLKYVDAKVTFQEIPNEISLCISISGCQIRCSDCHSKYLWEDIGEELKPVVLSDLIAKNDGITCVCFMGGEHDVNTIIELVKWVKNNTELKVGWYCGLDELSNNDYFREYFDYIKIGHYDSTKGGLNNPNTNQIFYEIIDGAVINKTNKFWKHETKN